MPKRSHRQPNDPASAHVGFTVVALGSRELLGLRPSWDRVVERLQQYSLGFILEILGRISIVLAKTEPSLEDIKPQVRILRGLFGSSSPVETALFKWLSFRREQNESVSSVVLFHERQLLTVAKVAFMSLPVDDAVSDTSLVPLGEALLMVSNLIEQDETSVADVEPALEEGRKKWEQFLLANMLFNRKGTDLHDETRGYLLYNQDRSHLRDRDPSYLNLPRHVQQLIGVEPDDLWVFLTSLNARWSAIDLDSIHVRPSSFDPYEYLTSTGVFTRQEVEGFLRLTAQDATSLKQEITREYSFDSIRSYSILPFARRPLIMIGSKAYCPSVHLLRDKLLRGTHHLLIDPQLVPDPKKRQQYLDFMGHVFEDYVQELLRRTYASALGKFIPEDVLKRSVSGKVCDGVVLSGDTAILIECKANVLPLGIREASGWKQYVGKIEDIFVDGARQLHSTIEAIQSGSLRELGINPERIRHYVPVVVTLEDVPMNHMLYGRLRARWASEHLLALRRVLPLQVLDIGELEVWEAGTSIGKSMHRRLVEKASDPDLVDLSFGNYLYYTGDPVLNLKNPFLLDQHRILTRTILQRMEQRRRESTSRDRSHLN